MWIYVRFQSVETKTFRANPVGYSLPVVVIAYGEALRAWINIGYSTSNHN
jgi:hypothetical protein